MKETFNKKKLIINSIVIVVMLTILLGVSYALFQFTLNGTKKTKIKAGILDVRLLDSNDQPIYLTSGNNEVDYVIDLDNQYPITDGDGLSQEPFEFKIKNFGSLTAEYTLYLDDVELEEGEERMLDQYIRYSLTKNDSAEYPQPLSRDM